MWIKVMNKSSFINQKQQLLIKNDNNQQDKLSITSSSTTSSASASASASSSILLNINKTKKDENKQQQQQQQQQHLQHNHPIPPMMIQPIASMPQLPTDNNNVDNKNIVNNSSHIIHQHNHPILPNYHHYYYQHYHNHPHQHLQHYQSQINPSSIDSSSINDYYDGIISGNNNQIYFSSTRSEPSSYYSGSSIATTTTTTTKTSTSTTITSGYSGGGGYSTNVSPSTSTTATKTSTTTATTKQIAETNILHKIKRAPDASRSQPGANVERFCLPKPKIYRVLYPYQPQQPDELELQYGDLLTVTIQCDDGWFLGRSTLTGKFGTFPGNYVEST